MEKAKINISKDKTNRIYEVNGATENIEGLRKWCAIDATYGKVPIPEQLKSAAKEFKNTREFAATTMLKIVAEIR